MGEWKLVTINKSWRDGTIKRSTWLLGPSATISHHHEDGLLCGIARCYPEVLNQRWGCDTCGKATPEYIVTALRLMING